jgi:2-hydroxychromene-2-carboxylate isomerase
MLEFYFDYASPWSYLASELLPARLPGAKIVYRPIYLRGLELFAQRMPYTSNKLRYIGQDLLRCAAHENIPIQIPQTFPVNGLYAVRGALALLDTPKFADYHRALFHAAWRHDRNVSDKQVVLSLARELGVELDLDDPALKDRLRQETAAADARGVFGVPSFFAGDEEMFWGHDRLDYVARKWKGRQET